MEFCDVLSEAARLNDEAVLKWALRSDPASVELSFTRALAEIHSLSLTLFVALERAAVLQDTISPEEKYSPFVAPLSVDVEVETVNVCFNKAFLLQRTLAGESSALDCISIAAAVICYNTALFFHQRAETYLCGVSPETISGYYESANRLLQNYLDRTSRPLWTLQAALWYNTADCCRFHTATSPSAVRYFTQLHDILVHVTDPEDRDFFVHALSVVQLQLKLCCTATAA
jgi:hypothetical protein